MSIRSLSAWASEIAAIPVTSFGVGVGDGGIGVGVDVAVGGGGGGGGGTAPPPRRCVRRHEILQSKYRQSAGGDQQPEHDRKPHQPLEVPDLDPVRQRALE